MEQDTRICRRPHRTAAQWVEIVNAWRSSGLGAEAFAKEHDIGDSSLRKWSARLDPRQMRHAVKSATGPSSDSPAFLPIKVTSKPTLSSPRGGGHGVVEIEWPGGPLVRVRGDMCPATLSAVLRAVAEVSPC